MSENVALASPELSERHSVDYDGPLNIFYTSDCELKSVLVNVKNAVICRSTRPQVMNDSLSLIVFKRLPAHVDHDSFRVEINNNGNQYKTIDNTNNVSFDELTKASVSPPTTTSLLTTSLHKGTSSVAYIQDVRFDVTQMNENDDHKLLERYNCLVNQLRKEKRRYHYLTNRYQRLFKQQNVLENFSNNLLWNVSYGMKDKVDDDDIKYDEYDDDYDINVDNFGYFNDHTTYNNRIVSSINNAKLHHHHPPTSDNDFRHSRQYQQQHKFQSNKLNSATKSYRTRSLTRVKNMIKESNVKDKNFKPGMIIQNETLQLNQIEAMRNFFTLYTVQSQQLDEDVINVDEELEQCKIKINQLTEQLDEIELCRNQVISKELHVLLESHSTLNPNLEITYTVDHVSWTPSYDIRLSSSTATLKIIYYGIIRQNTGEDWDLGKLTLSTAEHDHFSNMPELILEKLSYKNTENVIRRSQHIDKSQRKLKARSFHTDDLTKHHQSISQLSLLPLKQLVSGQYHYNERKNEIWSRMDNIRNDSRSRFERSQLNGGNHQRSSSAQRYYTDRNENHLSNDLDCVLNRCPSPSLDSIILKQENGNRQSCANKLYSTTCPLTGGKSVNISNSPEISSENYFPSLTFEISKPPKCIRGNGEPHRVTIGTLEFKPQLQYITMPRQTPKAFLRVTMHNISEFALLEGHASVYIDSNFIGKTKLSATAVQEEFTCELGYDPGVRVTYMPRHKYQKSGKFLGNKTMSIIFKQIISVENSYPRSIKLLVIDQLPVSAEEKLKVQLIEPSIKNPDKYDPTKPVRISKTKLVEWDVELAPYESRELVLKYLVEHPAIKDIDISTLGIR
ncbi:hypothetical protein MN116_000763 [Schistosoma mekongi]|uniref:DUF4139 domain-containing protein n=1 Tax=Schistosoma mekongi TaxID=38744 RepID=A0AAE1ZJP2_SCHME|nr:hypothetical protein MN116_000763 [Schistosoma mekongi]